MSDANNRVVRTAGQVGLGGYVVTVGEWTAQHAGWHGSLPAKVAVAMAGILTVAFAKLFNLND